jgi:O-antigen ligase
MVIVFGSSILLLLPRWRDVLALLSRNKALVVVLTVVLASTLWSAEPGIALRRALALILTSGFALWLAMRFPPALLMRLTFAALALVAIASLVAVVAAPSIGIHAGDAHAGRWRGVLGHKNQLGRMMSLGIVLTTVLVTLHQGKTAILVGFAGLFAVLLAMTGSATAVLTIVLALLVLPLTRVVVKHQMPIYLLMSLALVGGIVLVLVTVSLAEPILAALGRDTTLSGRTRLWQLALAEGAARPFLGVGFRTFWLENGPGSEVMTRVSWGEGNIGNGHNAYLDIWLELGLLGLLAYGALLQQAANRIAGLLSEGEALGPVLAIATVHISLYGMTERVLLEHSDLSWLLLTVLLLQATPALAQARRSAFSSAGVQVPLR